MPPLRLTINGAAGRMGQRVVALAAADPQLQIIAAVDSPNHPRLGEDAGLIAGIAAVGVPLTGRLDGTPDAVIDFSMPAGAEAMTRCCLEKRLPLVMATTGLNENQQQMLREASSSIPLLWSPSMSLTVNLAMKLAEIAGRALASHPSGADVEIIERHHRFKEDAPSGTALRFGEIIGQAMGISRQVHGREGRPGKRPHDEIGYHAVRTGDNPGEHSIVFGLLGETLELSVRASNRDCYAQGALMAAVFLAGKPPGLYGMSDVLGL